MKCDLWRFRQLTCKGQPKPMKATVAIHAAITVSGADEE